MELDENYKYLGTYEGEGIDNSQMKDKLVREYYHLFRQILKTKLNSKYKITAINTLVVQVQIYSFGIVNWLKKETEKMDQKTRKLLNIKEIQHPKADVNRLYIKRWNGGCGLVELESAYNAPTVSLSKNIKQDKERPTRLVQAYDAVKTKYSLQKEANPIKQKYVTRNCCSVF